MRFLTVFSMCVLLSACGNDFNVPSDINTAVTADPIVVEPITGNVTVTHSISLSVEMTEFFKESCTQQIDAQQPPLPEPARSQAIDACVITTSQEFINTFMQLINQQMQQQQGVQ